VVLIQSKNKMHVDGIPQWRPVGFDSRPETQRPQNFGQPPVVTAIAGLIESDQFRIPFLIDIEPRDQVIRLDSLRRW
jgi:hypothetical protein